MNRFMYPVVAVYPTHSVVVDTCLTWDEARRLAAWLDVECEVPGVWHTAEPCGCDQQRAN